LNDLESKKRQILDRVDILQVVSEHVKLKRRGRRWVGLCCFHSEKTPSLSVDPDRGFFKCFGCGKGGDVFTFLELRENLSFFEALQVLADRTGIELAAPTGVRAATEGLGRRDIAKVNAWAMQLFRTNARDLRKGEAARAYLKSRQVSEASIERFCLGVALLEGLPIQPVAEQAGFSAKLLLAADFLRSAEDGRVYETFRNRLMFPIRDASGQVLGFGGRTLEDHPAKYINTRQTPLFEKGRGLYGMDLARPRILESGRVILVEGYMDCIAVHQAGFSETLATLGTALTEAQVELLRRFCDNVILLFDSDRAGEEAADRAIQLAIPQGLRVRMARIPDGKDPADFLSRHPPGAFEDVLKGAVDALEFKWLQTVTRFEAGATNARRGEAVLDFLRVVSAACESGTVDVIQQGLLTNQVAHLLRMDPGEVRRRMAQLKLRREAARPTEEPVKSPVTRVEGDDEEQTAWRHLLGAILNKSELLIGLQSVPDFERIRDERDRGLAKVVFEIAGEMGEFRLIDVLARCHTSADVDRLRELAERGAAKGNYEATFGLALERVDRRSRSGLLDPSGPSSPKTGPDGDAIREAIREHRHFAPRRMIRQVVGTRVAKTDNIVGPA